MKQKTSPSDTQMPGWLPKSSRRAAHVHLRATLLKSFAKPRHKKLINLERVELGGWGWRCWGVGTAVEGGRVYATSQGSQQIETSVAEYGKRAHSKGCWEFLIGC